MFTTDLNEINTRQIELQKQAEQYRLLRSLKRSAPGMARIKNLIGQLLIQSGQLLVRRAQLAH